MPYETPVQYKKQIRQHMFDISHILNSKSDFKCAVIGQMIKKLLKSPWQKEQWLKSWGCILIVKRVMNLIWLDSFLILASTDYKKQRKVQERCERNEAEI